MYRLKLKLKKGDNMKKQRYTANDKVVAYILKSSKGVSKASDFVTGHKKYIKKLDVNTEFSQEVFADTVRNHPHFFKKYIVKYVNRNPKVQKVVYGNMRMVNKIING